MGKSVSVVKDDKGAKNVSTEYVVKHGKIAVGHAAIKSQLIGVISNLARTDAQQGIPPRDFQVVERVVTFTDHEEIPTGDDAVQARGEVVETVIDL